MPAGGLARYFVVSARIAGAPADANGCALFLVDAKDAGVALREFRLVDDTAAGELVLTQAAAQPLANPEDSTRTRLAIQGTVADINATLATLLYKAPWPLASPPCAPT